MPFCSFFYYYHYICITVFVFHLLGIYRETFNQSLSMFNQICFYVCKCVCLYVCMYVGRYICVYLYMYVSRYICIYIYIYICLYVYIYVFKYLYMCVCDCLHSTQLILPFFCLDQGNQWFGHCCDDNAWKVINVLSPFSI